MVETTATSVPATSRFPVPAVNVVTDRRLPIVLLRFEADSDLEQPEFDELAIFRATESSASGIQVVDMLESWFRGAPFGALDRILANGIDVDPPTAAFYAGGMHKASWYGGWPKLILALDRTALDRSYRRLPPDTPAEDVAALRETFPTLVVEPETGHLWLSRQREGSSFLATAMEAEYGFWLPDPSRRPLRALFVATHPGAGGDEGVRDSIADALGSPGLR